MITAGFLGRLRAVRMSVSNAGLNSSAFSPYRTSSFVVHWIMMASYSCKPTTCVSPAFELVEPRAKLTNSTFGDIPLCTMVLRRAGHTHSKFGTPDCPFSHSLPAGTEPPRTAILTFFVLSLSFIFWNTWCQRSVFPTIRLFARTPVLMPRSLQTELTP